MKDADMVMNSPPNVQDGSSSAMQDLEALERVVAELGSVAVGLSGGVDSSLLAAVCQRVLGDQAVAVIARSASLPQRELDGALATAAGLGIDVEVVETEELDDPRYAVNPRNRCMFCKDHQFAALKAVADRRGFAHLAHGEVVDDLEGHRPGRAAAQAWAVVSPLVEAGLDKQAVRRLARWLDLPVWDKPALACLASRIPTGSEVTVSKLEQIERAEAYLFGLGFRAFRVRHHGELARLELPVEDHRSALEHAENIKVAFRELGFEHVTLDLSGLEVSRGPVSPVGPRRELPLVVAADGGRRLEGSQRRPSRPER